ncbi:MAG: helix-turn-helix domain-containing protein [Janthinobacterium lividum]
MSKSCLAEPGFRGPYPIYKASLTPAGKPRDVQARMGRRLRELRCEQKLTQIRMAVKFGIDRSFISDVELGKKAISLPMLEIIALGLHMSLSELLDGV